MFAAYYDLEMMLNYAIYNFDDLNGIHIYKIMQSFQILVNLRSLYNGPAYTCSKNAFSFRLHNHMK